MTPKEKAKELFEKFMFSSIYFANGYDGAKLNTKTCSKIAVNQIIESFKLAILDYEINSYHPARYWELVKQEIENL